MKAPLKLSSEMRVLLAALVLVALVGGWYTWNNRTTDAQITGAQSSSPSVTAPVTPAATAPTPGTGNTGTGIPGTGASRPAPAQATTPATSAGKPAPRTPAAVTPARPTTVLTIPPLSSAGLGGAGNSTPGSKPAASGVGVTETDAEVQRPPSGINPNTPLAAVPVVNPFSPLKVVADPNSSPAPVPATAQVPQQQIRSSPSVAVTPPVRTAGVLPSTPIPVAEVSAAPNGPRLGGILPAPAINTGVQAALDAEAAAEQKRALAEQAIAQAIAQADAKRTEAAQAKAQAEQKAALAEQQAAQAKLNAAAKAQADKAAKAQAIAEAKARLLAAQQAKRAADLAAAAANARAKASATAPTTAAISTTPVTPAPSTAAPVAVTPENNAAVGTVQPGVITQLGSNAPSTPATAIPAPTTPLNTLDRYLQERSLSFDSVVLGPLNTAIFKTDRGLVVVSVGQNIPDTNIVVREVTANSATLALDTNTKTIQLEKR